MNNVPSKCNPLKENGNIDKNTNLINKIVGNHFFQLNIVIY